MQPELQLKQQASLKDDSYSCLRGQPEQQTDRHPSVVALRKKNPNFTLQPKARNGHNQTSVVWDKSMSAPKQNRGRRSPRPTAPTPPMFQLPRPIARFSLDVIAFRTSPMYTVRARVKSLDRVLTLTARAPKNARRVGGSMERLHSFSRTFDSCLSLGRGCVDSRGGIIMTRPQISGRTRLWALPSSTLLTSYPTEYGVPIWSLGKALSMARLETVSRRGGLRSALSPTSPDSRPATQGLAARGRPARLPKDVAVIPPSMWLHDLVSGWPRGVAEGQCIKSISCWRRGVAADRLSRQGFGNNRGGRPP